MYEEALWALQFHEARDRMNAATHCAPVKYSEITFRLALAIQSVTPYEDDPPPEVATVLLTLAPRESAG